MGASAYAKNSTGLKVADLDLYRLRGRVNTEYEGHRQTLPGWPNVNSAAGQSSLSRCAAHAGRIESTMTTNATTFTTGAFTGRA